VLKELSVYAYSLKITQGQAFQQPYTQAHIIQGTNFMSKHHINTSKLKAYSQLSTTKV
jgi:hypothetical protein